MANITQESVLTETQQKAFRMKVKQALLSYDEIGKKLRDRVIEYLVEGGDATCLLELSAAYQDDKRKRFFKQQNGIHLAPPIVSNASGFSGCWRLTSPRPVIIAGLVKLPATFPKSAVLDLNTMIAVPSGLTI